MVLKNYCKCFNISGNVQAIKNIYGSAGQGVYYATSNITNIIAGAYSSSYRSLNYAYSWVDVGYGDTPETPDDYILADGNSALSGSNWVNRTDGYLTPTALGVNQHTDRDLFSIYANFVNNSGQSLTVKEVGVYTTFGTNYAMNSVGLIMRKVLDTPITIAPGDSYSFTYRLRIKDN